MVRGFTVAAVGSRTTRVKAVGFAFAAVFGLDVAGSLGPPASAADSSAVVPSPAGSTAPVASPADSSASPAASASSSDGGAQPPAPRSSRGAGALLEKVLRRYGSYQDFQARFVESAASRVGGEDPSEYGTVSFKRPEMWRWEYSAPERKVVVIRGSVATIKIEGDPDVASYDLGTSENRSDVGALLAGNESLAKLFKVRYERAGTADEPWLRLDPVKLADEYDHVLVKVNTRDLTILGVVVVDPGGNSLKFAFSDLRANAGLPTALFDPPARSAPLADPPRPPAAAPGR